MVIYALFDITYGNVDIVYKYITDAGHFSMQ